jgi:hypothetical protein
MASAIRPRGAALGCVLAVGLGVGSAQAQQRLAEQCPLIVPAETTAVQPKRILPSQVAGKNAMGCLSPSDAIYGPDGCPVKMCGQTSGAFALPGNKP